MAGAFYFYAVIIIGCFTLQALSKTINFVKPQNFGAICPDEPCLTLEEYAYENGTYFVSNTTYMYLTEWNLT